MNALYVNRGIMFFFLILLCTYELAFFFLNKKSQKKFSNSLKNSLEK